MSPLWLSVFCELTIYLKLIPSLPKFDEMAKGVSGPEI